jgi:hypothetical protein
LAYFELLLLTGWRSVQLYLLSLLDNMTHAAAITVRNKAV